MADKEYEDNLDEEDMHREDIEDRDVYKKDYRDHLTEDDEISPEEEGFMEGYDKEED
ncbi:MAG: hypothetical protein ACOCZ6_01355 [Nanoarchaeota archaeon]